LKETKGMKIAKPMFLRSSLPEIGLQSRYQTHNTSVAFGNWSHKKIDTCNTFQSYSNSSGVTALFIGITDFFSTSRGIAFLISVHTPRNIAPMSATDQLRPAII
jgi:hypothetical protein